jgi:glutamine synthetase
MRRGGRHELVLAEEGAPTESAAWLIAGLVQMSGALMAFGNRLPLSFVRLSQGKEAPSVVTWGRRDREALIRIPVVAHDSGGNLVTPHG